MSESNHNLKSYYVFWFGQLTSILGSAIVQFVIIWWITLTTQSAFYLGLAAFLGFGSMMLIIPFAGVLVDRWSRKLVLAISDTLQAIFSLWLIFLFYTNTADITSVLVILTIRGFLEGFHTPAFEAIIPVLVPEEKLREINGLSYFANGLINVFGPVLGAVLLDYFGIQNIGHIIWIDMITFLIAVIPLFFITIPSVRSKEDREPFFTELKGGIQFIRNSNGLLSLLSVFTTVNFFTTPVFVLLPLIINSPSYFNSSQNLLGYVLAVSQIGVIIGSLYMTRFQPFKKHVKGVILGVFFMYLSSILLSISAIDKLVWLLYASSIITGLSLPVSNVSSQTIWQKVVPLDKQARVYSVRLVIAQGLGAISMLLSGILAGIFDPISVIFYGAIAGAIILTYSVFRTNLLHVEQNINQNTRESIINPSQLSSD